MDKMDVQSTDQNVINNTISLVHQRVASLVRLHELSASHSKNYEELRAVMRAQSEATRSILAKLGENIAEVHEPDPQYKTKTRIWLDGPSHCLYKLGLLEDSLQTLAAVGEDDEEDPTASKGGVPRSFVALEPLREKVHEPPTKGSLESPRCDAQQLHTEDSLSTGVPGETADVHDVPSSSDEGQVNADAISDQPHVMAASLSASMDVVSAKTSCYSDAAVPRTGVPMSIQQKSSSGTNMPSSISDPSGVVLPALVGEAPTQTGPRPPTPPTQPRPLKRSPMKHRILGTPAAAKSEELSVKSCPVLSPRSSTLEGREVTFSAATTVEEHDDSF